MSRAARIRAACCAALFGSGCAGPQHALDTHGPAAARIADLWWIMLALALAVCIAVAVLLALAIRSALNRRAERPARSLNGAALVWAGGVALPVVIIFTVLLLSYRASTVVYPREGDDPDAYVIDVIGHLFWWEVRYPEGVITANEVHLPVGRTVEFRLTAADVIHSFWVPSLQGKRDLIPGQVNTLRVVADEPGRFRGQCAEFCGEGHALMAFWVVAHEPRGFAEWIESARTAAAAREPGVRLQPLARRGRDIFFAAGCGACHSTRGAPVAAAAGQPGPDLSDLASRSTLAAGTVPNTPASLRRWIRDPQAIKPGALMPPTSLSDAQLDALVAYLETLR